ncbi:MAG: RNA 2',3'-cyclic phosphodiesterase [Candidatus Omnitrophica bacterium]|nr:RNA 2',3'-cyclic phosphodiesterase [Candidatus Omnitrophota bacterium]
MRAFIAIELPNEIRDSLNGIQEKLKACKADVRWVAPENIHLTLKFLGEVNEEQLSKVKAIMETIAGQKKIFNIRLASVGAFPNMNYPRVIWAGVDNGGKEAEELACALEEKIEKIGIPKEERAFSSHITIGRIRSNLGKDRLTAGLKQPENYFKDSVHEFSVNKLTLFKSTLTPKGPIYEIVKEANLTTA